MTDTKKTENEIPPITLTLSDGEAAMVMMALDITTQWYAKNRQVLKGRSVEGLEKDMKDVSTLEALIVNVGNQVQAHFDKVDGAGLVEPTLEAPKTGTKAVIVGRDSGIEL